MFFSRAMDIHLRHPVCGYRSAPQSTESRKLHCRFHAKYVRPLLPNIVAAFLTKQNHPPDRFIAVNPNIKAWTDLIPPWKTYE
jgi:hypothetical protein